MARPSLCRKCRLLPLGLLSVTHITCVRAGAASFTRAQITRCALYKSHDVRYPLPVAQLAFQRARTEENKRQRAAALVEAARSLALETGVASVTLTAVANRAGVHYSAVRRDSTSHKEVLLHLAAEDWFRWSNTVCAALREPGRMSPSPVAETLANGLAADSLFCDLLANFTCTSSTRWISTGL